MKLLFMDPTKVDGVYTGSQGAANGTPQFINLDNVLWGTIYRGSRTLLLTMANGGTWQLTFPDNHSFRDAYSLFYLSKYDPEDN